MVVVLDFGGRQGAVHRVREKRECMLVLSTGGYKKEMNVIVRVASNLGVNRAL